MSPGPSRAQIAVFAGLGIVLVLLAAKALSGPPAEGSDGGVSIAAGPVAGEVEEPGVYRLAPGARVTDALERAGGATAEADQNAINLAAMLADGQQVVVPAKAPAGAAPASAPAEEGPISLGSATEAELETIDGIGPVTAADIVEFRDASGGVGSIEELDEIPGIGPATIAALSERLQP